MTIDSDFLVRILLIGAGATLVMDAWALFLKRCFNIPGLNYAMVGRWIGHLPRGRFIHPNIGKAEPVAAEAAIGWIAHYAIGVVRGPAAAHRRTAMGAAPDLPARAAGRHRHGGRALLHPAARHGRGHRRIQDAQSPVARLRSLMAHASFGVGLYLAGLACRAVLAA